MAIYFDYTNEERGNPIPAHPVNIAMKKMQDIPEVKYPAAMAERDRANFLRENSGVLTRGARREPGDVLHLFHFSCHLIHDMIHTCRATPD